MNSSTITDADGQLQPVVLSSSINNNTLAGTWEVPTQFERHHSAFKKYLSAILLEVSSYSLLAVWSVSVVVAWFVAKMLFFFSNFSSSKIYSFTLFVVGIFVLVLTFFIYSFFSLFFYKSFICFQLFPSFPTYQILHSSFWFLFF